MIVDKLRVFDGWDSLAAGMDAGRRPSLIEANQCARGKDVVFRGGTPRTRPGIKQLALTFETDIAYDALGGPAPPAVVHDAHIGPDLLFSNTANFTAADVGSFVLGASPLVFASNYKIVSFFNAGAVGTSGASTAPDALPIYTITILGRRNPQTVTGVNISAHQVTAPDATLAGFNQSDVGQPILSPALPAGTVVTAVQSPVALTTSVSILPVVGTTITLPNRVPVPVSEESFHLDPFQCASYYSPANNNECIMATFGGRLFQITPGVSSARIREIPLGVAGTTSISFNGSHSGPRPPIVHDANIIGPAFSSATANFTLDDVGSVIIAPSPIIVGTTITAYINATTIGISDSAHSVGPGATVTIVNRPNPATGSILTANNAIFQAGDSGATINGANLPGNSTFIKRVLSSTQVELNFDNIDARNNQTYTFNRSTPVATRNRSTILENWMVQADKWHVTQDGEAKPIIYDGVSARRANDDEVIVGKAMAYGIGRLVVTRDRDIYFGDLFGSHAGDPSDSILKFTETNFLSEGFPAEIPYTLGNITATTFFPSQDSSTGQGELLVFTERGAVSFDLHLPRDQWKTSIFQQIALINSTARGNRAVTMVNSDLWIRSDEGWRAYRQARALAAGWYQLPQSTEVTPWTNADTPDLLRFGSAINFDNRLIATCNPIPNQGRLYHDGLLSLDFSVLSSFGQATRPAWDGRWTKLKVLQLVTGTFAGKHRAFAFGLDADSVTQLYEITTDHREDFDGPITSEIEFRSHNFNSPFNEKSLYGADIWVDDTGPDDVSLELTYRPDSSQDYLPWFTGQNILPPGNCGDITCGMCPTVGIGYRPRIRVPKPTDDCDDYTGRMIRRGYEFQPKLRWTGHASIRRMRLQAMQEEEDSKGEC